MPAGVLRFLLDSWGVCSRCQMCLLINGSPIDHEAMWTEAVHEKHSHSLSPPIDFHSIIFEINGCLYTTLASHVSHWKQKIMFFSHCWEKFHVIDRSPSVLLGHAKRFSMRVHKFETLSICFVRQINQFCTFCLIAVFFFKQLYNYLKLCNRCHHL